MQEIKFRFWSFKQKTFSGPFSLFDLVFRAYPDPYIEDVENYRAVRYTGLKDKNGKEIYEGDILENFQADVNIVHWWGGGWHYENYHAGALPLYPDNEKSEVIGNIYENPELIK